MLDQRPGAGVEVDEGRSVIVIVGRFEAPEEPATTTRRTHAARPIA